MKTKLLLRFYFYADGVDKVIDNLILAAACGAGESCERTAGRIAELYRRKDRLAALWEYLDNVVSRFGCGREILQLYADGGRVADERLLKRTLMRFRRRAEGVSRFTEALDLLRGYAIFCHT